VEGKRKKWQRAAGILIHLVYLADATGINLKGCYGED